MPNSIEPIKYSYSVDFFRKNNNILFIESVQEDGYQTRYVEVTLLNNGALYAIDTDSVQVIVAGTKPDHTSILNECEIINENTVKFEITPQMSAVPGRGKYEIIIKPIDEDNVKLTSFPFYIVISKSAFDSGNVLSSDEYTLFLNKINEFILLKNELLVLMSEINASIVSCENQTNECRDALLDLTSLKDEIQLKLDLIDSLDLLTVTDNAINATNDAENVIDEMRNILEEAQKMLDSYQALIQIDDTIESETKVWSSAHTSEVITDKINTIMDGVTTEEITELFAQYKDGDDYI